MVMVTHTHRSPGQVRGARDTIITFVEEQISFKAESKTVSEMCDYTIDWNGGGHSEVIGQTLYTNII